MGPLGRREPADWVHVERWSLPAPPRANLPVVMGTLWLAAMDKPEWDSGTQRWWICRRPGWQNTPVRGGHAYCLEPRGGNDRWYGAHHDQQRGSCTGHSTSRAGELIHRRAMDPEWLYEQAQLVDEWADTPPEEGSSVRAAFDVWRAHGQRPVVKGRSRDPNPELALTANRWATSGQDILATLGHNSAAPILQSWGLRRAGGWPHRVWIPGEALDWLLMRGGEAGVPVS